MEQRGPCNVCHALAANVARNAAQMGEARREPNNRAVGRSG